MESTIGRNDPCPCGSGKKYKNCCITKHIIPGTNSLRPVLFGIGIFIGLIAVGATVINMGQKSRAPMTTTAPAPNGGTLPQAFRPLPDGNAGANNSLSAPNFTPGPQPPGPVPEGKVWSVEHGHWHDIAAAPGVLPAAEFVPKEQPPGPVPEGKVWSVEHGHWHNIPADVASAPGTEVVAPAALPGPDVSDPSVTPVEEEVKPVEITDPVSGEAPVDEAAPGEDRDGKPWSRPSNVDVSPTP